MRVHEQNATGTLACCLASVRQGVKRFVYVSSSEVYGTARRNPMGEDHPLSPTTVYGATKAGGELIARACMRTYGIPVSVVRLFNAYGPRAHATGDGAEVVTRFVRRILADEAPVFFGDGRQSRDFTWVGDSAAGIVAAAECDGLVGEEPVNIARGSGVSLRELSTLLLDALDARHLSPELREPRAGDVAHQWADTSRAQELMGFAASTPLREGLERYAAWVVADAAVDRGGSLPLGSRRAGVPPTEQEVGMLADPVPSGRLDGGGVGQEQARPPLDRSG